MPIGNNRNWWKC